MMVINVNKILAIVSVYLGIPILVALFSSVRLGILALVVISIFIHYVLVAKGEYDKEQRGT